jgi:hypothetical protein
MGIGAVLVAAFLSAAVPDEMVLLSGRVQLQNGAAGFSSHHFELTISYREGRFANAELCIFAPLGAADGWQGTCLHPEPAHVTAVFAPAAFAPGLGHADPAAQRLLLFLMRESYRHLPGERRIVGYDMDAPLEVRRTAAPSPPPSALYGAPPP